MKPNSKESLMRIQLSGKALVAMGSGLALTALWATPALAAPDIKAAPSELSDQEYVILDAESAVHFRDGSVFYPTGDTPEGALLVIPDEETGELPLSIEAIEVLAETGSMAKAEQVERTGTAARLESQSYVAAPYAWSGTYTSSNTIHVPVGGSSYGIGFKVTEGSNQQACGQGRGAYRGYYGSNFGVWTKWYGAGCAISNSNASASIPMTSNTLTNGRFKAMSTVPHLATGWWWATHY